MTSKTILAASRMAMLAAAVTTTTLLGACAPLIIGGAMVGTALSVTDRRTGGAQVEDQAIELKAIGRLREAVPAEANISITSYNRTVLITGEAPTEAARTAAEQAVARIDNVRATVNELAVMGSTTLSARSNDAILSSKVKAAFVDAKDLQANAFKVVAERGAIYLMGRVTEREANRATELARATRGVGKVVKVFEILTEAELAALQAK